jgi:5'-3' exonuclease
MFLNAVKSYTDMYKADKVICVWDEKPDYRKNKRKELLEEYKGNRKADTGVHDKNELIKELLQLMGIPSIYPRDYEADDAIGIIDGYFYDDEHVIVTVEKERRGRKIFVSLLARILLYMTLLENMKLI